MSAGARRAILWAAAPPEGVSPSAPLLGLPLARRVALAAARAGFDEIHFEDAAGAGAKRHEKEEEGPARVVVLGAGAIPQPGWLKSLLAGSSAANTDETFSAGDVLPDATAARAIVVDTNRPDQLLEKLAAGASAAAAGNPAGPAAADAGCFFLTTSADLPAAETWLLQSLVKENEGFFSRHLHRRISLALTRRLVTTPITPNAMTLISVAIGLAGAGFFLSQKPVFELAGSLLFLAHSIVDGCDGELARLKFAESRFGGVLDFWGDNVVHCAVFACLAIGWSRSSVDFWPLIAGAAAIAGTLLAAGFVFRYAMPETREGPQFTSVTQGPQGRMSRIADALARRDFIYLVVLLSAFGKAHWFLALAAVGAPIFFLVLVGIETSGRRLERSLS